MQILKLKSRFCLLLVVSLACFTFILGKAEKGSAYYGGMYGLYGLGGFYGGLFMVAYMVWASMVLAVSMVWASTASAVSLA